MTMASDVFKARFDGGEWWAQSGNYKDSRIDLFADRSDLEVVLGAYMTVPAHMVVRVEDIPPEPTEPGVVMYDREGVAWLRAERGDDKAMGNWTSPLATDLLPASMRAGDWVRWPTLVRERGPLHPYPPAAREEIERLTAQLADARNAGTDIAEERYVATAEIERLTVHLKAKDAHAVEMAAQIKRLRAERNAAQSAHGQACAAADELQRRIDRALDELASLRHRTVDIAISFLRGEVDQ
jgi:hypothetical protein